MRKYKEVRAVAQPANHPLSALASSGEAALAPPPLIHIPAYGLGKQREHLQDSIIVWVIK